MLLSHHHTNPRAKDLPEQGANSEGEVTTIPIGLCPLSVAMPAGKHGCGWRPRSSQAGKVHFAIHSAKVASWLSSMVPLAQPALPEPLVVQPLRALPWW